MTTPAAPPPRDHPELGDNPITDRLANAFSSRRLLYRAAEPNDEDSELFYRFNSDPDPAISSSVGWPRPYSLEQGKTSARTANENKGNILIVIVCLDPAKEQPGLPEELKNPRSSEASATTEKNEAGTASSPNKKPKPVPIGMVALRPGFGGHYQHHNADLGIDLLADYHGRGYGSEMMRWMLDWGFDMAHLHRVSLGCFSWNTKAIRAYEAVGFERAGVEREALWCAGRYWDHILYGMLDRDWMKIREARKAKGLR